MLGVLIGFSIIGFVILVGYIVQRSGIAGDGAGHVLGRIAFFVTTPALLFTVLAHADVALLFSRFSLTAFIAVLTGAVLFLLLTRLFFRTSVAETALGAASASYANTNNIGLPVAIYVLGNAQYVAPVLLMQLLILAPTVLGILDASTSRRVSVLSILTQPFRNPIIIASLLGVLVAIFGITLPEPVLAPLEILGGAAIPMVLLAFGMSLPGQRLLKAGSGRKQVLVASAIKVVVMPVTAYLIGRFVFDLSSIELFAVTTISALPTAQNVYNFAARYDSAMVVTRDVVLLTTIASLPVLFLLALFLA
jgi:malonate transporter